MNCENGGGIPSLETLQAKYRLKEDELRDSGKANLSVRMHRSLSWLERAQKEKGDPDAAFIFHWIGFEALCSDQSRPAAKKKILQFLKTAVRADRDDLIYNRVVACESKTILTLVANAYVYTPFWNHYYGELSPQGPTKWADSLIGSVRRMLNNLKRREAVTFRALEALFECLRELRNQMSHGGATWESSANRDQVGDGARIMSCLLPVFLDLMMDNPNSFAKSVGSPPPDMDSPQIIAEHNAYVCRLAEITRDVYNSEYREYLREAIERELTAKQNPELTARVHAILYSRRRRRTKP